MTAVGHKSRHDVRVIGKCLGCEATHSGVLYLAVFKGCLEIGVLEDAGTEKQAFHVLEHLKPEEIFKLLLQDVEENG